MLQSVRPDSRTTPTMGLVAVAVLLGMLHANVTRADEVSDRDPFFRRLSASMTSIVDGKPFRDALGGIANQAQINLWIDRHVDPTAPVEAGPVGPTVFEAIAKIAAKRDCVVMPVANVLLVGRPTWVDQTAASILSLKLGEGRAAVADVTWDDLTTPQDALQNAASRGGTVTIEPALPHDLWPSAKLEKIDRRVAVTLVLAQFDRRPESTGSLNQLKSVAASDAGRFTRTYTSTSRNGADAMRTVTAAMTDNDRNAQVRSAGNSINATGKVAAHRAAVRTMLEKAALGAAPDPDKDTFTLKRMTTSAENALRQLAQSAQKTCVIQPDARDACRQNVSIEGKDVTLRELIDMVARQAGVTADWQGDTIVISAKK